PDPSPTQSIRGVLGDDVSSLRLEAGLFEGPGHDPRPETLREQGEALAARRERPLASLLGGAYDGPQSPIYQLDLKRDYSLRFNAIKRDKHTLSPAFGARMCADADAYLWAEAPNWGTSEDAHRRVRDVGRRWGESTALARDALR